MRTGLDYAYGRPSPAAIKAAGYTFVSRYLSPPGNPKNLSKPEADLLQANGISVVSNWEYFGDWAHDYSGGYSTGQAHAAAAARMHLDCGGPASRPIYFSVDFDPTDAQLPVIGEYYRGVASVIGLERTGAYGGFRTISYLFDHGLIRWGWQTWVWSGGLWDARAQVRQVQTNIWFAGVECDIDEAWTDDFGQWDWKRRGARVISGGEGVIYGVDVNGDLQWYRHLDPSGGSSTWASEGGTKIGSGWNVFTTLFGGADGVIYGVDSNGDLQWYRHLDPTGGDSAWAADHGTKIGSGWNVFTTLFGGADGVIYGVDSNGDLQWYRHLEPTNGVNSWAVDHGTKIGSGWNVFTKLFGGADGVIYGVDSNGDLQWYRHLDPAGGSSTWASDRGTKIGSGWNTLLTLSGGADGVIYGIQPDGDLLWYRHLDPTGGGNTWASDRGTRIGSGWNIFIY